MNKKNSHHSLSKTKINENLCHCVCAVEKLASLMDLERF